MYLYYRSIQQTDNSTAEVAFESSRVCVCVFKLLYFLSNGRGKKERSPGCEWSVVILVAFPREHEVWMEQGVWERWLAK